MNLEELKAAGEAPAWMTAESYATLSKGYLLDGETPRAMYRRIAKSAASYLPKHDLEDRFFEALWNNWLCPSTPVSSNSGTTRGLPISCFSSLADDDTGHILDTLKEVGMMSKYGGGTAVHFSALRPAGSPISKGGTTDGIAPFIKMFDSVAVGISQGNVRRGSTAVYLDIEHGDFDEFVRIRRIEGDMNRQSLNIHHGVTITDAFMEKVVAGDQEARRRWQEVIKTRFETGEPYIQFIDNVNKANPDCYKANDLSVKGSNLCLTGDVAVHTECGVQLIGDLAGAVHRVWDGTGEWVEAKFAQTSEAAHVVRVTLSNGFVIRCTPEHRLVLEDGSIVQVKDLDFTNGDIRLAPRRIPGYVTHTGISAVGVEDLGEIMPTYCCTVPDTHVFALECGIMSGNCNEITLHTDPEHSFVCCLSSLNLARWDEWKDTDLPYLGIMFLDGIMSEFIEKAEGLPGFERALRFAKKSRALGLGVLGLHTLFQRKMLAFDSLQAYLLNGLVFKTIQEKAKQATRELAEVYGEPEWCQGFGVRNTHLLACAPTVSNSLIASNVSPGIEPWAANAFSQTSAKGTFFRRNPELVALLEENGKNTDEVWKSIVVNKGSVQHLSFLSDDEKKVFETAREMNQFVLVKLAGQRQQYIDQGQSLNLFFPANSDPRYINKVHIEAWKEGVKGLYYMRTESSIAGEAGSREYKREATECSYCEG